MRHTKPKHLDTTKTLYNASKNTLIVTIILMILSCISVTQYFSPDIHDMVAYGNWMIEHKQLLTEDVFSLYKLETFSYQNWLAYIGFAITADIGAMLHINDWLIIIVHTSEILIEVLLAHTLAKRFTTKTNANFVTAVFILVLITTQIQLNVWSQTGVLLLASILLIDNIRNGASTKQLLPVIVFSLIWTNIQGTFSILFVICITWLVLFNTPKEKIANALSICFCACIAAFINPYQSTIAKTTNALVFTKTETSSIFNATNLATIITMGLLICVCLIILDTQIKTKTIPIHLIIMACVSCIATLCIIQFINFAIPLIYYAWLRTNKQYERFGK